MKYGKVLTYKDIEEAKKLIGKMVLVSDYLRDINECSECVIPAILVEVKCEITHLFITSKGAYQFIREVIEGSKPEIMTNRQLAEWLARGNGEYTYINSGLACTYYGYFKSTQNDHVSDNLRIRSWDSEEWVMPTVDIYERDCK